MDGVLRFVSCGAEEMELRGRNPFKIIYEAKIRVLLKKEGNPDLFST